MGEANEWSGLSKELRKLVNDIDAILGRRQATAPIPISASTIEAAKDTAWRVIRAFFIPDPTDITHVMTQMGGSIDRRRRN